MGLLSANNCLTEEAKAFIYQPVEELVKRIPKYMGVIAKGATGIGAVANRLMGKGEDGRFELSDTGGVPWNGKWKFLHNKQYFQKRINYLKKKYKGYYLTNYYLKDVDDGTGHMKYMSNVRANAEAYDRANPQSLADGFRDAFNVIKGPLSLIPGVGQALDVADEIIGSGNFDEGMFGRSTQNRTVLPPRKKQGAGKRYEEAHIEDGRHVMGRWVDDTPIKPRENRYASQEEIKAMNGAKYDPNDHTEELARNKKFLEDFAKNGGAKKKLTEEEEKLKDEAKEISKAKSEARKKSIASLIDEIMADYPNVPKYNFPFKNKVIENKYKKDVEKGKQEAQSADPSERNEIEALNKENEYIYVLENATKTKLLEYYFTFPKFNMKAHNYSLPIRNEEGRTEAEQIEYNIRKAIKKDLVDFILSMPELAKLYQSKEPKIKSSRRLLNTLGISPETWKGWTDDRRSERIAQVDPLMYKTKTEIVKALQKSYTLDELRKYKIRISKPLDDLIFAIKASKIKLF